MSQENEQPEATDNSTPPAFDPAATQVVIGALEITCKLHMVAGNRETGAVPLEDVRRGPLVVVADEAGLRLALQEVEAAAAAVAAQLQRMAQA